MSDCPFCCKLFTSNGTNAPRVLSCGHSICNGCVDQQKVDGQVKCIECERATDIIEGVQLPLNHSLIEMIAASNCVFHCNNWKRRHAKYFCNTCSHVICTQCSNSNAHSDHSINLLSSVAKARRARLQEKKPDISYWLETVLFEYDQLEEIKEDISENQAAHEKRLVIGLKNVLEYENCKWTSEREQELLNLIRSYKRNVEEKLQMLRNIVQSYKRAMSDVEKLEKMTDGELVLEERTLTNLETFEFHNENIPSVKLGDYYPIVGGGNIRSWEMKYVVCFDCQFSTADKFSSFLKNQDNVFPLSPRVFIVHTPEIILHITFEKGQLPEPHSVGMYCSIDQGAHQVYFFKIKGSWGIKDVSSSFHELDIPHDDVRLYETYEKENDRAFSEFLKETQRMGRITSNHLERFSPHRSF